VVTSRFPGLELLVVKHALGRACDPESPQDIATALASIGSVGNAARAAESRRLRRVFNEALSYDAGARILEEAVASRRPGQPR
jgi:hypothetical protein